MTENNEIKALDTSTGFGELRMAKVIYDYGVDGGGYARAIIPERNVVLPNDAVIVGGTINSTTAVTSDSACNIEIGTYKVGATATDLDANAILTATGKASFSLDALINAVPTFAAPVKLSEAATISITPTAVLTAGVVEIVLYYFIAK